MPTVYGVPQTWNFPNATTISHSSPCVGTSGHANDTPFTVNAPKCIAFNPGGNYAYWFKGSLPLCQTVTMGAAAYRGTAENPNKWDILLPSLRSGTFYGHRASTSSYNQPNFRLEKESVLHILGSIPTWDDGEDHSLKLAIVHTLEGDGDIMHALGSQNEDGTYKGSLVRTYSEYGSFGPDRIGKYDDEFVEDKGWKITVVWEH